MGIGRHPCAGRDCWGPPETQHFLSNLRGLVTDHVLWERGLHHWSVSEFCSESTSRMPALSVRRLPGVKGITRLVLTRVLLERRDEDMSTNYKGPRRARTMGTVARRKGLG